MNSHYETSSQWGGKISLDFNNPSFGAGAYDVLVTANSNIREDIVYNSVRGEKAIREFLYAFAVIGGLIKEGERLIVDEPSDKDIPADGTYKLECAGENKIAIVQGGRVMVPQPTRVEIADFTDVYLSKYSGWELTPLKNVGRHV
jgi:hypothetical protein